MKMGVLTVARKKLQSLKTGQVSLWVRHKWYAYILLIPLVASLMGCDTADIKRHYYRWVGYRAFRVPSGSMDPTLKLGEYFIATVEPYRTQQLRRGDIVTFPYPRIGRRCS